MNKTARFALLFLLFAILAGCGTSPSETRDPTSSKPAATGRVTVFAAASTTNALDEIRAAFSKDAGVEVRISYAASSTLARQIENGADTDVFFSADKPWADYVESRTPVAKRRDLLSNRLVIVVPGDSNLKLAKPEDLLAGGVKQLALGEPDACPAGRYAKQTLTKLGLWDKLKSKIVSAEDVRHALTYVETGAAEAGIVYATDAAASKKVKVVVELPADRSEPVRYPVLLLKREEDQRAAHAFYEYLASPDATKVFEKYGFIVLSKTGGAGE